MLVLGDPAIYARFDFRPERGILPPHTLPTAWSEAWQSVSFDPYAAELSGKLHPPAAWNTPALWAP
ncbi:hypothetical protein [Falsiroseomonas sp. E2-1-a4]|uniref:hypothetical protein n=1 Tax=Falsiroseomonas sp. E2-1-a4 TaxID=3239299 RepID=UPI003F3CB039